MQKYNIVDFWNENGYYVCDLLSEDDISLFQDEAQKLLDKRGEDARPFHEPSKQSKLFDSLFKHTKLIQIVELLMNDKIDGLSPVIAIEQKTTSKSPRSTVGTITEIYDFLRLLYARVATGHSPVTGLPMVRYTLDQIVDLIVNRFKDQSVSILAPIVRSRKGHYRELFESLLKQGFLRARIDGIIIELSPGMKLDRYKTHDIELVIDRFPIESEQNDLARIKQSVSLGLKKGNEVILVHIKETNQVHYYKLQEPNK